jgi:hypothetical protein
LDRGDLERKLALFKEYYNRERTHDSLGGATPAAKAENLVHRPLDLAAHRGDLTAKGSFSCRPRFEEEFATDTFPA